VGCYQALPADAVLGSPTASAEAAISRLYGGIHYRMAIEAGIRQGRDVGDHIVRRARTRADRIAEPGAQSSR
jgi:hypothetical protein